MSKIIRIGTRESQLAVWQANSVKKLLQEHGIPSELIYIKSEGDTDLTTPLYEIGVQGIFTRALDVALLKGDIDVAVHSMKDVPTQLPAGIAQAAVLPRASYKDLLVPKVDGAFLGDASAPNVIATSSIRRKAQWLNRYPNATIENLRGNVNTRLRKVQENEWQGAIFAAAGLERIGVRPENAVELDWMLPAPAQGAVVVVARADDAFVLEQCAYLNDKHTAWAVTIERDFLRGLMGGCATPISAFAQIVNDEIVFQGSILSVDGKDKVEINKTVPVTERENLGQLAAIEVLANGGEAILNKIRNGK